MKIFRISQRTNIDYDLDELTEEAKRYDSPEDFASAYSVKHNLKGYGIPINNDGTVTLYHASSPERIQKIKEEGFLKGGATATGGMTGLQLKPSAFLGWQKDWVNNTWGNGESFIEIKVPYQYIRQPAQNDKEVYFEGGLSRVDEKNNVWEPLQKPRDTFYSRIPSYNFDFVNSKNTLKAIWEKANSENF